MRVVGVVFFIPASCCVEDAIFYARGILRACNIYLIPMSYCFASHLQRFDYFVDTLIAQNKKLRRSCNPHDIYAPPGRPIGFLKARNRRITTQVKNDFGNNLTQHFFVFSSKQHTTKDVGKNWSSRPSPARPSRGGPKLFFSPCVCCDLLDESICI